MATSKAPDAGERTTPEIDPAIVAAAAGGTGYKGTIQTLAEILPQGDNLALEDLENEPLLVSRVDIKPGDFGLMAVLDVQRLNSDEPDDWGDEVFTVISGGRVCTDKFKRLVERIAKNEARLPVVVTHYKMPSKKGKFSWNVR